MKGNRKRLIPFKWRNVLLGLSGDSYERAEIEYYNEGPELKEKLLRFDYRDDREELEKKLLEFRLEQGIITQYMYDIATVEAKFDDLDSNEAQRKLLTVEHFHGNIGTKEFDRRMAELDENPELSFLDYQKRYNLITDNEYDKQKAQLLGEPWVAINDVTFDADNPERGAWTLDWNDEMIEFLHANGYAAPTEEQTINMWINDICKGIALEAFDGVGNINERLGGENPEDEARRMQDQIIAIDNERYLKK